MCSKKMMLNKYFKKLISKIFNHSNIFSKIWFFIVTQSDPVTHDPRWHTMPTVTQCVSVTQGDTLTQDSLSSYKYWKWSILHYNPGIACVTVTYCVNVSPWRSVSFWVYMNDTLRYCATITHCVSGASLRQ